MKRFRRVAVVGGGIFGVTAAIEIARAGCLVDLFERNSDLLLAASGINQYRLHRGYHYPRSIETAVSCKKSEKTFREMYGLAVIDDCEHYYCISARDSKVSADAFVEFCHELDLEYEFSAPDVVKSTSVDLCVRVRESLYDPQVLRSICKESLMRHGVQVYLNTIADAAMLEKYDFNVVATYASLNEVLDGAYECQKYQFEVCEKPVVRLPPQFGHKSIVVLDGPFMCVDPLSTTGLFVLGNVVHAIHHVNVGLRPEIPKVLKPILNSGVVQNPPVTHFRQFVDSAMEFLPIFERLEFVGSMFTIRTVLPEKHETDERPTVVTRINDRIVTIFSGKVGTCVETAREVVDILT